MRLQEALAQSFGGRTPVAPRSVQAPPLFVNNVRDFGLCCQLEDGGWLAQTKGVG